MSEQTMKILQMLEDGKITVEQANELLSRVQELEEREKAPRGPMVAWPSGPSSHHGPGIHIPEINIPPIPPIPHTRRRQDRRRRHARRV